MEPENVPYMFIPIKCTSFQINRKDNYDHMKINLSITTPGPDGAALSVYSGLCRVQRVRNILVSDVVEQEITTDSSLNSDNSIKVPVIIADVTTETTTTDSNFSDQSYQSQVWNDPPVSPYVHNHDLPQNDPEQVGYKRTRETPKQLLSPEIFNLDEESESEMLSQLPKKKKKGISVSVASPQGDIEGDDALKELMMLCYINSSSEPGMTNLHHAGSSEAGQTTSTQDPKVKCSAVTMDNDPPPTNGGILHQPE